MEASSTNLDGCEISGLIYFQCSAPNQSTPRLLLVLVPTPVSSPLKAIAWLGSIGILTLATFRLLSVAFESRLPSNRLMGISKAGDSTLFLRILQSFRCIREHESRLGHEMEALKISTAKGAMSWKVSLLAASLVDN